jgi:protoporphyrinogen oxidase
VKPISIFIIGAGPAGLTAAVEALEKDAIVTVVESSSVVGGISQTVEVDGWRFDLGGHRFFTKVSRVEDFWKRMLPPGDFLTRPRLSRIYYKGKFFDYPLKPTNAFFGLGAFETFRCISSYLWARISKGKDQTNFEGWVSKRFGWRLYSIFFKTYTEKVWGISATELSSAWAAQRIKDLSLSKAIADAFGFRKKNNTITTLINSFEYPRLGPGMMWEKASSEIQRLGGEVAFEEWPLEISRNGQQLEIQTNRRNITSDFVISSMPLSQLPSILKCQNQDVLSAANNLKYRDFLTVGIVIGTEDVFPDNWIYIHSPDVKVGRIQNFRSWSPELVKPGFSLLGLEYFVNIGDNLWNASDDELISLACDELESLGIAHSRNIVKGYVVRVPKAYPVYDDLYASSVDEIAAWLKENWPGILPVGRNGMHRYNNQDHSMLTAMLAVENLLEKENHDLWSVNVDDGYHEESSKREAFGGRSAPIVPRK